jgi:hypothetical protein
MKVILQSSIRGLSGAIEDWVYQYRDGKTYVGPRPRRTKEPSQAELDHRARFKEATVHAKSAMDDPALRALYETIAEEQDIPVFAVAVRDYMVGPSIMPLDLTQYKGQVGDVITIRANDDIGLADLEVSIVANDGSPIERGKAVENGLRSGKWTYTATAPVALGADIFIEVTGVDHAGTRTKHTESPRVGEDS